MSVLGPRGVDFDVLGFLKLDVLLLEPRVFGFVVREPPELDLCVLDPHGLDLAVIEPPGSI